MMDLETTPNHLRASQLQPPSPESYTSANKRNDSTEFGPFVGRDAVPADCRGRIGSGPAARCRDPSSRGVSQTRCRNKTSHSKWLTPGAPRTSMSLKGWVLGLCLLLSSMQSHVIAAAVEVPDSSGRPGDYRIVPNDARHSASGFRRRELLEFNVSRGLSQDETILLSWKDSSSYLSAYWVHNDSSGPCGWSGIGCEEWRGENRVTVVYLPSLGLTGPIPPNVYSLSALKVLNFTDNNFTGSIPMDLGQLDQLQSLDLSRNRLNGTIPPELFANCSNLGYFNLSSNRLNGTVPPGIGTCSNLRVVDLGNNSLKGEILVPLGRLSFLEELIIADNKGFYGSIPETILSNCQNLIKLDVAWNQFSGPLPPQIASCSNLELLIMQGNYFSGSIPGEFGNLKRLKVLALGSNNLTGTLPLGMSNCSSLELLDVGRNNLTGPIPAWLSHFPNLHYLTCQLNSFFGTIPVEITTLPSLRYLDLSENELQGGVLPELGGVGSLRMLRLSGNNLTGRIPEELGRLSNLQGLDLSSNSLNGSIPLSLGKLQDLLWLQLGNNTLTGIIPQELSNCSSLMWVNLAKNRLRGHIPENFSTIGWDSDRVFRKNQQNPWILDGVGECSIISTWSPGQSQHFQTFLDVSDPQKCHSWLPLLVRGGLALRSNRLTGESKVLGYWQLGKNQLSGPLPNFTRATRLGFLILSENQFKGPIPEELGSLPLYNLNISHNLLNGTIPNELGNASLLVTLDMAHNDLSGSLPLELGNLNAMTLLNVSYNVKLSGTIPSAGQLTTLGWTPYIGDVHLCFNDTNPLLKNILQHANWTTSTWANATDLPALCSEVAAAMAGNENRPTSQKRIMKAMTITTLSSLSTLATLLIFCTGYCMASNWRKRVAQAKREREKELGIYWGDSSRQWSDKSPIQHTAVASFGFPCLESLTYADLIQATKNFSPDNIVGDGGFGVVYKAKLANGATVAVKKLVPNGPQGPREFQAEMETLGMIQHENLVSLIGYCCHNDEMLLVYEYFKNGSLDDWLHESDEKAAQLAWPLRLRIALETARGLAFLHHQCVHLIIHRDMKSSNILLNEAFKAVLTDFGMARIMDIGCTHVSTVVAGTPGYVPPEYSQTWRATTKGDVYSFGVVMLELLAGKRPTGPHFSGRCGSNLIEMTRILVADGRLDQVLSQTVLASGAAEQISSFLALALRCTASPPSLRPSMLEVVQTLETISRMAESFHPSCSSDSVDELLHPSGSSDSVDELVDSSGSSDAANELVHLDETGR